MYDELVKRLRICPDYNDGCVNCQHEHDLGCRTTTMREAADAIEGLSHAADQMPERRKNPWIPVTERLPDAGERVLCYCRANIYEVMKMRTDGDWVYDTNHVYMHSFVTHWMLLPQPPKEE